MELREPANRVSPRAKTYWMVTELTSSVVILASIVVVMIFWEPRWWLWVLAGIAVASLVLDAFVIPRWRYRQHRWEVSPTAVYTQRGWLSLERRIAPISRIQTVDTARSALQRSFGLSTVTVTTASSAGAMKIECLDQQVAEELVAHLTVVTEQSADDAT